MKTPRISYFFLATIGVLSFSICYYVYPFKDINDIIQFTATAVGFIVSVSAFIIAIKTYFSIDSVYVISQMDGNVLENESYVTSFTSLLRDYNMEDEARVGAKLFDELETRFKKKSKTAMEFASNLQYFIDVIVFFPYLFTANDEKEQYIKRMNHLVSLIDKRKKDLLSISKGNLILIDETVTLIKSITNYQQIPHRKEKLIISTILDVKGTMLKNSVTQTIYYNYLGLYYNSKANSVLRNKYGLGHTDFYSIDGLKNVKKQIAFLSNEDRELFTLYLKEAKKAFHLALSKGKDDVMWEGFIKFNEARTTYLLQQVLDDPQDLNWLSIMNEAIIARKKLNIQINDILEGEESHLKEAFQFEFTYASLLRINILISEKKDITDTFDRIKYHASKYDGLSEDVLIKEPYEGRFNKIRDYQDRIKEYLKNNK